MGEEAEAMLKLVIEKLHDRDSSPSSRCPDRHRGLRHGADLRHAAAGRRQSRSQAHEGGRERTEQDPPARARASGARREGVAAAIAEAIHAAGGRDFQLNKWLGQEEAREKLVQAGYRGQAPYVTFLFFRMVTPLVALVVSAVLHLRGLESDQPLPIKIGDRAWRRLSRHAGCRCCS